MPILLLLLLFSSIDLLLETTIIEPALANQEYPTIGSESVTDEMFFLTLFLLSPNKVVKLQRAR
jgi:hypothetical protein